ncbi:hypothetical protein Taro_005944 [Colocasia esculenta]|uniref:Uncharacterized protein n=1 Tax=Colocasia esculenta TaxID=4460 RepID=A0A843TW37_COLES|nr:hypothetical protein [Colocasia esculenta]
MVWCPNSSPRAWSRTANAIAYGHPFAQTGITFRSVKRIDYKTPIQNRHSEAPTPPYCLSSASLDYANRRRGQHTESAYHGDRKSCSTRLEISTLESTIRPKFRIGTQRCPSLSYCLKR